MADSIARLYEAVRTVGDDDTPRSRTSRLVRAGKSKAAKKMAEEAVEVVIDAMNGDAEAVVQESADLIYNLVVLWSLCGVTPDDVWQEMDRRERLMGIAEKLPKKVSLNRAPQETGDTAASGNPSRNPSGEGEIVALEPHRRR